MSNWAFLDLFVVIANRGVTSLYNTILIHFCLPKNGACYARQTLAQPALKLKLKQPNEERGTPRHATMAMVADDIYRPTQEEIDSHYKPGSIKNVKLVNFLTYDKVEFCPGPR